MTNPHFSLATLQQMQRSPHPRRSNNHNYEEHPDSDDEDTPLSSQFKTLNKHERDVLQAAYEKEVARVKNLRHPNHRFVPRQAWGEPACWKPRATDNSNSSVDEIERRIRKLKLRENELRYRRTVTEDRVEHDETEVEEEKHSVDSQDEGGYETLYREYSRPRKFRSSTKTSVVIREGRQRLMAEKRARLLEEIAHENEQKKLAEDEALAFNFKARDVPPSTLVPKFQVMAEEQEARSEARRRERKARLEESLQPFVGMEQRAQEQARKREERQLLRKLANDRQAKNNTSTRRRRGSRRTQDQETFEERMARQEVERKVRIENNAKRLYDKARLPPRMQEWEDTFGKEKRKMLHLIESGAAQTDEECTFRPRINHRVPDFEKTKQVWESTLMQARLNKEPTCPDVEHLSMFSADAKIRADMKRAKQVEQQAKEELKNQQAKASEETRRQRLLSQTRSSRTPAVNLTKSQALRLRVSMEKRHQDREAERAKQEADEKRRQREQNARTRISQIVQQVESERQSRSGYLSLQDAERRARERAKEDRALYVEKLRQVKANAEQSKQGRVSLIHANSDKVMKEKVRREALSRVAMALGAGSSARKSFEAGGNLNGVFEDDELLDPGADDSSDGED